MREEKLMELDGVSVSYFGRAGEAAAVTHVSLDIAQGEALGLVGESGCGKTTLAAAIMGHFSGTGRITRGRIVFQGRDMAGLGSAELRKIRSGGIGMVYQDAMSALNPSLTIGEQLAEVVVFQRNTSWKLARREALSILQDVQLPDPARIAAAYPHQLSGGQQQRVVIAMALIARPALLLLDEPTTALDVTIEAGIVELIASLRARHRMALLYISHNLGLIAQVCDRVAVMYAGEIIEQGPIDAVFAQPRHPYTRGLIGCIPLPHVDPAKRPLMPIQGQAIQAQDRPAGCAFGQRCAHFDHSLCGIGFIALEPADKAELHVVRCCRWRTVGDDENAAAGTERGKIRRVVDDAILSVRKLDKNYAVDGRGLWGMLLGKPVPVIRANQELSFDAFKGQTLAIVGESGCGKTTLAKVLTGLEVATAGEVRYENANIGRIPAQARTPELLRSLQMVFQNPDETLNPSFSVGTQIARAVGKLGGGTRERIALRTRELLEMTHLTPAIAARRAHQLSGGQRQRVAIARAFAGDPRIVVADEPVSALDVSVRAAITRLLMDIQQRHGTTLVLISHDLGLVRYIADRVVVMYLGRVMEQGTVEELFLAPYHPYTEALLSAVPLPDPRQRKRRIVLTGELPNPLHFAVGCPFHSRCPRKVGLVCENDQPPRQQAPGGHEISCHIPVADLLRAQGSSVWSQTPTGQN